MEGLSKAQGFLIDCLKFLNFKLETIIVIMMAIPEDNQIAQMVEYLEKHQNPTEREIVEEAIRISETEL